MRKGTKHDRDLVVDLICRTFRDNSGISWMFRKSGRPERHLWRLANYAFYRACAKDGIFISENEKSYALCFRYSNKKQSLSGIFYRVKFGLGSIGLRRLPKVLKREGLRRNIRPHSGEYYYFWFFGALHDGKKGAFEIKNAVFDQADKDALPIYIETTVERMVKIYEWYGFTVYHELYDSEENVHYWFMKREPGTSKTG